MLKTSLLLGMLLLPVLTVPALALSADDTMMAWSGASEADRDALLDTMGPSITPAYGREKPALRTCLDEAGGAAAHAALTIREIARTCAAIVEHRDPDAPQDSI